MSEENFQSGKERINSPAVLSMQVEDGDGEDVDGSIISKKSKVEVSPYKE